MSPNCCSCGGACTTAAAWNAAIRSLVKRTEVWDQEALDELARLRAGWQTAVKREQLVEAA